MKLIARNRSIITGKKNLEHLYTFHQFPVFFGCVDHPMAQDIRADMRWMICPESGIIQLDQLIPLEILYQAQHVDATGQTWAAHNTEFADYINAQTGPKQRIMEIGGGAGKLAQLVLHKNTTAHWYIVEPNPLVLPSDRIDVIPQFFDEHFHTDLPIDTMVFSHVLEHAYDPRGFLHAIAQCLYVGQRLIFAYPNLLVWLQHKFTNTLNFEHTIFLTDYFVDYLLKKEGFTITYKHCYGEHSIFYTAKKIRKPSPATFTNHYASYKHLFLDFIQYYKTLVNKMNEQISSFHGTVYLFGGHIFSQYLIEFGLDTRRITAILDNSPIKQNKRLYGSSLSIRSPKVITTESKTAVILKVGVHRDEIYRQLKKLNPKVLIIE